VSSERERDEVRRELEERKLLPSRTRRLEIEADALVVARRALHLRGVRRERSEALEARYRQLAIWARADDEDFDE
jgi:hypothetical protein